MKLMVFALALIIHRIGLMTRMLTSMVICCASMALAMIIALGGDNVRCS